MIDSWLNQSAMLFIKKKKKKACPAKENFSSSSIIFSRTIWWFKISNLKNKFLTELHPRLILKNHTENKNYIGLQIHSAPSVSKPSPPTLTILYLC